MFALQVQTLQAESLLLVSTLDGSLHALSKQTGDLKWTLKDGEQQAVTTPPLDPGWAGVHRHSREDQNIGSRSQQASVGKDLHHLSAVWASENHFTSLSLKVLNYKMEPIVVTLIPMVLEMITRMSNAWLGVLHAVSTQ